MKNALLALPFVLAIAFVVCVEGPFSGFEAWNALPEVVSFGVLVAGLRFGLAAIVACTVFAASATLFMVLFHLAWLFDWSGTATGSSTSALAFIFAPLWAFIVASIAGVLAWATSKVLCKAGFLRSSRRNLKSP